MLSVAAHGVGKTDMQWRDWTEVEGMNANPFGIFGGVARLASVAHFCGSLGRFRRMAIKSL